MQYICQSALFAGKITFPIFLYQKDRKKAQWPQLQQKTMKRGAQVKEQVQAGCQVDNVVTGQHHYDHTGNRKESHFFVVPVNIDPGEKKIHAQRERIDLPSVETEHFL